MDLPKLYSPVYCKIEWVRDYCVGGEHEQRAGDFRVKVVCVLDEFGNWYWKPTYNSEFHYYDDYAQKEMIEWLEECSGENAYQLDWSYKVKDLKSCWKDPDFYY